MGRGTSKISGGSRTPLVDKTLRGIIRRTANLKNEQYRIIDEKGNVVLVKKGSEHEVAATVGEKREYLNGATSIHNHPNGGTFSPDDLSDFGYGAREMVVASPEGTYSLKNIKYGTPDQSKGWFEMREKLQNEIKPVSFLEISKQAQANLQNTKEKKAMDRLTQKYLKRRSEGAGKDELQGILDEYTKKETVYKQNLKSEKRRIEVKPFDDFYKKNARKYGFDYTFTKK